MVFSVSPSVIVREVDLTTSIPAIATPPAAIAGVFRWGPTDERVLISSENNLVSVFGKPSDFNAETFFTAADYLSYSNALYVVRVADASANTASSTYFNAKYKGELGNSLSVAYVTTITEGDTDSFEETIAVDTANITFNSTSITLTTTDEYVFIDGDILSISSSFGTQDLFIVESQETGDANVGFTYTITTQQRYSLPETSASELSFKRKWGYANFVNAAPAPGTAHIIVIDRTGDIAGTRGQILEVYQNLSLTAGAKSPEGTNIYYVDVLEQRSQWIKATSTTLSSVIRAYSDLSGGVDGANENTVSFGVVAQGYDLYREANEVDVSFILQGKAVGVDPASSSRLANYIVSNITDFRKDCVAFLSPARSDVVEVSSAQTAMNNILAYRNAINNSSYWFMDSGYKYRYDKYNDKYRWVPLNGDIAGLASRVESWESPAGYRKGIIKNVVKLAFNPNKTQRDILYGSDVNPVITQVGQGTLLFGDKTGLGTATGSAFTRLNVRRLFITVEKAIATISARFLFEFNDEFTQTQFSNIVNPFLRDIQGRRGIIDFRVVSDGTINTPDVIDRNIFRSNIFIKPARSINFIELTFVATRTGVEFEEIVGLQF